VERLPVPVPADPRGRTRGGRRHDRAPLPVGMAARAQVRAVEVPAGARRAPRGRPRPRPGGHPGQADRGARRGPYDPPVAGFFPLRRPDWPWGRGVSGVVPSTTSWWPSGAATGHHHFGEHEVRPQRSSRSRAEHVAFRPRRRGRGGRDVGARGGAGPPNQGSCRIGCAYMPPPITR
jgi:hypothetical protein